ncbi:MULTISPECIES: DUF5606 domain-containing protein [unclassified Flavobacterium]|uniref:DUF5606 family protein n=1 Tax=unclassified Flavobacterium TaxID=196869 RepID=UPI00156DADF5|nr:MULTISPECIES: DUF5606 domain-containing protein [unclassified Flavobacterium]MBE0390474.1 hypothetical protein [Flavobacterium sp. PL002]NRT15564.1 hypothetical protein [Flavobacterium sp. 28A]
MNLEKILAISGKPGLYVLRVQTRSGFVAESLADGKKITVNLKSNVSLLSEISIYTYEGEKPLTEIMNNIAKKENNGPAISHKEDNATLLAYFREVLTDFDEDRVYPSDVKKILNWYNILHGKGLVVDAPAVEEAVEAVTEEVVAEKPKKEKKVKE